MDKKPSSQNMANAFKAKRSIFMGLDSDAIIKRIFGTNAFIAIFILTLITLFLFKEGIGTKGDGFFTQYREGLELYRKSGLEYADIIQEQKDDLVALNRYLTSIRGDQIKMLREEGKSQKEIVQIINDKAISSFFMGYTRLASPLKRLVSEATKAAVTIKDNAVTNKNLKVAAQLQETIIARLSDPQAPFTTDDVDQYAAVLRKFDRYAQSLSIKAPLKLAERVLNGKAITDEDRSHYLALLRHSIENTAYAAIDYEKDVQAITQLYPRYQAINEDLRNEIPKLLASAPSYENPILQKKFDTFKKLNDAFLKSIPEYETRLRAWDQNKPVSFAHTFSSFLFGKEWLTASDQQDFYGLLPLFSGSLLIGVIALCIAVPFGVGAAIYVNQIAGNIEKHWIKPYIEFIEAIPSVVIGFFGVVVFGDFIREASGWEIFANLGFEPIKERLNAFTAAGLLALMAIPTIFTLSEDAINNVPKSMKEASLALGATRLQTTLKVIVPTALSGIISAVMLGFGRVVGETMVVLLCAGNMIAIPDFTLGLGVLFEPVHTMTGIIAQEMGEVVRESLHYRALFVVGIFLFFLSLLINFLAQWIVKKYSKIES